MTVAVNASPLKSTTDPEREPLPSGLEPRSGCHGHTGVGKPLYVDSDETGAGGREGGTILAMCDLLLDGKPSGATSGAKLRVYLRGLVGGRKDVDVLLGDASSDDVKIQL